MIERLGLFLLLVLIYGLIRIFAVPLIISFIIYYFIRKKYSSRKVRSLIICTFIIFSSIFWSIFPLDDFSVYKKTNPKQLSDCDAPEISYKGYCMQEFAIKTKNLSVCYLIKDDFTFTQMCLEHFRKKEGSIDFCDSINESWYYRDLCYSSFAYELKNKSVCQLIRKDDEKLRCEKSCSNCV